MERTRRGAVGPRLLPGESHSPSHVYALATGQGHLFAGLGDGTLLQSQDGGESWSELAEQIGGITALAVN